VLIGTGRQPPPAARFPGLPEELKRTAAVTAIAGAHDAHNAASRLTLPVSDRHRQSSILAWRCRGTAWLPATRPRHPDPSAKGRHHARVGCIPSVSERGHHAAALIPRRHRPAHAIGGPEQAHAYPPAGRGRPVAHGHDAAAQDDAPAPARRRLAKFTGGHLPVRWLARTPGHGGDWPRAGGWSW
jgi:hypothetical protein